MHPGSCAALRQRSCSSMAALSGGGARNAKSSRSCGAATGTGTGAAAASPPVPASTAASSSSQSMQPHEQSAVQPQVRDGASAHARSCVPTKSACTQRLRQGRGEKPRKAHSLRCIVAQCVREASAGGSSRTRESSAARGSGMASAATPQPHPAALVRAPKSPRALRSQASPPQPPQQVQAGLPAAAAPQQPPGAGAAICSAAAARAGAVLTCAAPEGAYCVRPRRKRYP